MELREYGAILRRRWWLPAALALIALAASAFVALRGGAAYRTDMRLAVTTMPTVDPTTAQYDPVYYANLNSEYLADDLGEFLHSEAFAGEVSRDLNSTIDITTISNATRTKKTHRFIDVTILTATREQGAVLAESIGRIVGDTSRLGQYLKALNAYRSTVTVVTPPRTDHAATTAGMVSEVLLRTLIGLFLGVALAFLLHYLDPTVRSGGDVEQALGLPVLAQIPQARRGVAVLR